MEVEVLCVTSMLGQSGLKKTLLIQLKDGGCSFASGENKNNSPKAAWDCSVVENMAMGWDFFMPHFTPHFSSSKFQTCTGTCWAIFLGTYHAQKANRTHQSYFCFATRVKIFSNNSKSYLACDNPVKWTWICQFWDEFECDGTGEWGLCIFCLQSTNFDTPQVEHHFGLVLAEALCESPGNCFPVIPIILKYAHWQLAPHLKYGRKLNISIWLVIVRSFNYFHLHDASGSVIFLL